MIADAHLWYEDPLAWRSFDDDMQREHDTWAASISAAFDELWTKYMVGAEPPTEIYCSEAQMRALMGIAAEDRWPVLFWWRVQAWFYRLRERWEDRR